MATDASGVYHVLALFTARHPDWPAYEARMTALADVRGLQASLSDLGETHERG
jgi:hypothetical protein